MIKLCICYIISSLSSIFLQVVEPIVKQSTESLQSFILQLLTMAVSLITAIFGFIIALRVNRVKKDIKADVATATTAITAVQTTVGAVETSLGSVHTEVEQLKKNTDGALKELTDVKERLQKQLGIKEGIEISKVAHELQSEKEKASNIAEGKVAGIAEQKAEQTSLPTPTTTGAVDVKVVNDESAPAEVAVNEKTKKSDK